MRLRPGLISVAGLALALIVAACTAAATDTPPASPGVASPAMTSPATSPATSPTDATGPSPSSTQVAGGDTGSPAASPGTFTVAWGEAWDALPSGFPIPSDADVADPGDPADGPVSGAFVSDRTPDEVATQVKAALNAAGYSTEALSGPSENGALVVDAVGLDPACRIQATVRPFGTRTMLTVLFGAACPWR